MREACRVDLKNKNCDATWGWGKGGEGRRHNGTYGGGLTHGVNTTGWLEGAWTAGGLDIAGDASFQARGHSI